jgi:enoyl-CoA hydratase
MRPQAPDQALQFWREEYTLNYTIAHYPKPYIAIMDGLVMGGGVGVSAHGRERIVTERSQIAMPETGIGLVPDVGGTYLLARAMGRLGVYLGLTGARMSASDAIQAGFADTFVPSSELPKLIAGLSDGIDTIEDVIEAASAPVPPSELLAKRDLIDRLFAGDTRAEVDAALLKSADPLARKAAADLALRSPLAVALCLEALRRQGSQGTLADALKTEYRLVSRLYEGGEFIEGVRALIVDKDKAPKWRPSSPGQVTPAMIDGYFAPRPDDWLV